MDNNAIVRLPSAVKDALRRNVHLLIMMCVIMLFLLPYVGLMRMQDMGVFLTGDHYTAAEIAASLNSRLPFGIARPFIAPLCGVIALIMFQHLGDRKHTQAVNALPLKRGRAFAVRSAAGMLYTLIPIIVCEILVALIVLQKGVWQYLDRASFIAQSGLMLLSAVYGFSVGALACALTGRLWAAVAAGCVIAIGGEVTLNLCISVAAIFLKSLSTEGLYFTVGSYSPIFNASGFIDGGAWYAPLIAAVVLITPAYIAYAKRRTEASGLTLAFDYMRRPLTVYITILGALGFGVFSCDMLMAEWGLYLGVVAGGLVAHAVCQICFTQTINAGYKRLIECAVCVAVVICAMLLLRTDAFGYDRYAPKIDNTRAVSVAIGPDGDVNFALSQEENVKHAVEWSLEMRDKLLSERADDFTTYNRGGRDVQVTFTNNNGGTVTRKYKNTDTAGQALRDLVDSREYKDSVSPVPGILKFEKIEMMVDASTEYLKGDRSITDGAARAILAAYETDLKLRTFESGYGSRVVCSLWVYDGSKSNVSNRRLPVIETDVNTLAKLAESVGFEEAAMPDKSTYVAPEYCALVVEFPAHDWRMKPGASNVPAKNAIVATRVAIDNAGLNAVLSATYTNDSGACWYSPSYTRVPVYVYRVEDLAEPFRMQVRSGAAVDGAALFGSDSVAVAGYGILPERVDEIMRGSGS